MCDACNQARAAWYETCSQFTPKFNGERISQKDISTILLDSYGPDYQARLDAYRLALANCADKKTVVADTWEQGDLGLRRNHYE